MTLDERWDAIVKLVEEAVNIDYTEAPGMRTVLLANARKEWEKDTNKLGFISAVCVAGVLYGGFVGFLIWG